MKTIRAFVLSKVRRAEVEAHVRVLDGPAPHERFGAAECAIETDGGRATFFEGGLVVADQAIAYGEIERIERGVRADGTRLVRVTLRDQGHCNLVVSLEGGTVLYDTLRWIGRALHRRRWDAEG